MSKYEEIVNEIKEKHELMKSKMEQAGDRLEFDYRILEEDLKDI